MDNRDLYEKSLKTDNSRITQQINEREEQINFHLQQKEKYNELLNKSSNETMKKNYSTLIKDEERKIRQLKFEINELKAKQQLTPSAAAKNALEEGVTLDEANRAKTNEVEINRSNEDKTIGE